MLHLRRCVSSDATALPILRPMDRAELRRHLERLDAPTSHLVSKILSLKDCGQPAISHRVWCPL
ncbi:hypothetical protein EI541_22540 [Xanthomonas citri pv. eucalyptorum]|nr:hypothetical protein EI541_22540 [Xanthomonas axonopodis pv. eucalyptorum]